MQFKHFVMDKSEWNEENQMRTKQQQQNCWDEQRGWRKKIRTIKNENICLFTCCPQWVLAAFCLFFFSILSSFLSFHCILSEKQMRIESRAKWEASENHKNKVKTKTPSIHSGYFRFILLASSIKTSPTQ